MAPLIIFSLIAFLCMGAGFYIWINKATHLLHNFPNQTHIRDNKGLSGWAGIFLTIMGLLFLIIGLMTQKYAATKYELVPLIVSVPIMYLMIIVFLVRGQRFIK